uniref:Selenoprotein P N-terminal domain-containing protein n=1 Tax=Amphilophus citrinellus TaxID=61819 RepID=A0A3Q0SYS4_AMPCI
MRSITACCDFLTHWVWLALSSLTVGATPFGTTDSTQQSSWVLQGRERSAPLSETAFVYQLLNCDSGLSISFC